MPGLFHLYTTHSVYPGATEPLHDSTSNVVLKPLVSSALQHQHNNIRCYNLIGTLDADATRVQSSCPTGGSSCSSSCQSSILTYRNNAECCVNIFNTSALTEFIAAGNYSLWASCSVETPGFCTQSTVRRPSSGAASTQYPLSKLLTGLLLLGVVMVLML